jgi:hypothetical protein
LGEGWATLGDLGRFPRFLSPTLMLVVWKGEKQSLCHSEEAISDPDHKSFPDKW